MEKKIKNFKNIIKGPVFSLITPFYSNGKINYKSYFNYLDFYYSQGVRIFYLMLYNSRLGLMNENEASNLNIKTAQFLKKKYKDVIIIGAEKFEGSSVETVKRINKVYRSGVDIFSVILGEKYYSDDQVYSHFSYINKYSKLPLLLHLQKIMNGYGINPPVVNFSIELTKKILSLNKFVAIKEDTKDDKFSKNVIKYCKKNISIIKAGGGMRIWKKYKKLGCQSWLTGLELLEPKIAFDYLKALEKNDKQFIKYLESKIEKPFFKEVSKYGWHIFIKSCLEDCGIMSRFERLPLKQLDKIKHKKVQKFMQKLRVISKKYLNKNYFTKKDLI